MISFEESAIWCRSCGAEPTRQGPACSDCGADLAGPAEADADVLQRVGEVISVGRALFKRPAIAVAETAEEVQLISKGDERTVLSLVEFDAQQKIQLPGPPVMSAAGRLWKVAHAVAAGTFKAGFSVEAVDRVAWDVGRRSMAAIRASILDRLAIGAECDVSYLPVTPSEMAWYRACAAATAGRTGEMLEQLGQLPIRGYRQRCRMIIARAADLVGDRSMAARSVTVLSGLAPDYPLARALVAALGPSGSQVPGDLLVDLATAVATQLGGDPTEVVSVARALQAGSRLPALPLSPLPYAAALDAYLAGLDNADLNSFTHVLTSLPLECVDELIDVGALTKLPADFAPWTPAISSYLRARVAPGAVDESTLRAADFAAELARRAFLRSDRATLRELDQNDPGVLHYTSLLDLRDDLTGDTVPDGLHAEVAELIGAARAIAKEGMAGPAMVSEVVLSDPTLWPLLQKAAELGNLRPAEPAGSVGAEFASWSELCALQRRLFDGEWSAVIADGNALANRTSYQAFADEALNMAAFAALQLGQLGDATKLIDRALDGEFSTGLMVNAAVLASSRGCLAALPYLSKIFQAEQSPKVKAAAVRQALDLWRGDALVKDYPPPLAELVRMAMVSGIEDDLYLDLAKVSAYQDEDWLAGANLQGADAGQRQIARYFEAMARMHSDKYKENFVSFCEVAAKSFRLADPPDWVLAEKAGLLTMLDEGVHCDFGEAIGFALGIDVLVKQDVLDLLDRVILGSQAVAHIVAVLDKDGGELSQSSEQRLLHDSIDLFFRRRGELTESQIEYASEDLARCTSRVALHWWGAVDRNWDGMADQFNSLNQRKRWDQTNFHEIVRLQRGLMTEYEREYLVRARAILSELEKFALTDSQRTLSNNFEADVREKEAEITRLRRTL